MALIIHLTFVLWSSIEGLKKWKIFCWELRGGYISNKSMEEMVTIKELPWSEKGLEDPYLCSKIFPGVCSASILLSWTHNTHWFPIIPFLIHCESRASAGNAVDSVVCKQKVNILHCLSFWNGRCYNMGRKKVYHAVRKMEGKRELIRRIKRQQGVTSITSLWRRNGGPESIVEFLKC